MKLRTSDLDTLLKISLIFIGSLVFIFGLYQITKPDLDSYPELDSCFKTSVHKILLCTKNPNYVSLGFISENLVKSIAMSEDDKFFSHHGVDWIELKNSIKKNISEGHFARGGSTITQQLVKNAYLSQDKSIIRKLKEFFLARALEKKYSKPLILEKYLNLIEFGQDLYGVKRAARLYFQKSVSDLNLLESLYLTTLIPNPRWFSKSYYKKKLTPAQVEKIEKLLYWFRRRGQIEENEYQNLLANIENFPWKSPLVSPLTESTDGSPDNTNAQERRQEQELEAETQNTSSQQTKSQINFKSSDERAIEAAKSATENFESTEENSNLQIDEDPESEPEENAQTQGF